MSEWDNEAAEWYAEKYGEYATNRLAVDALEIDSDAVVVDVGCGTGCALRRVAPRAPEGQLIGVDPVPRMLEIARERAAKHPEGDRLEFRQGSAESLPVDDRGASLVFAFDSMDHWQNRAAGLAEVRRILRSGGRFVVVKDGGVPGSNEARRELPMQLEQSGFELIEQRSLREGTIECTMWVCG